MNSNYLFWIASQVLYTFLNRNHEAIVITDDVFRIQYANKAAERLFDVKVVTAYRIIFTYNFTTSETLPMYLLFVYFLLHINHMLSTPTTQFKQKTSQLKYVRAPNQFQQRKKFWAVHWPM